MESTMLIAILSALVTVSSVFALDNEQNADPMESKLRQQFERHPDRIVSFAFAKRNTDDSEINRRFARVIEKDSRFAFAKRNNDEYADHFARFARANKLT
uniref:Inhibitor_I29 domain-containing protein n=1 Tax=Heterorhabditis bacteriophora TaxID=37862 RepID=A0A1I7XIX7_HETBA